MVRQWPASWLISMPGLPSPLSFVAALAPRRRKHHDLGADLDALVEIDHVLIDHADAAGGDAPADGPRLDGAVDAEQGVLVALPQVHGARSQRIARSARHADAAPELAHLPHELGLARKHLLGRIPVGPLLLVVDGRHSRPAEAFASHADAITDRPTAALDEIKIATVRVDDDGARLFVGRIRHLLAQIGRVDIGQTQCRNRERFASHAGVKARILTRRAGIERRRDVPWLDHDVARIGREGRRDLKRGARRRRRRARSGTPPLARPLVAVAVLGERAAVADGCTDENERDGRYALVQHVPSAQVQLDRPGGGLPQPYYWCANFGVNRTPRWPGFLVNGDGARARMSISEIRERSLPFAGRRAE